jgi:hypothetical protein
MGFMALKRTNTSFVVSGMRLCGRWNLRVALDASLVRRKRLETLAIAPKTNSERIAAPLEWTLLACTSQVQLQGQGWWMRGILEVLEKPKLQDLTVRGHGK